MLFERAANNDCYSMYTPHIHNEHELYFLVEGSMKYFVGNEIFILKSGDFIFIPKGTFHQTSYDTKAERFLISFDDNELDSGMAPVTEELSREKKITILPEKLYKIERLINMLENEDTKDKLFSSVMKRVLTEEILLLILRYKKTADKTLSESHAMMQNIAKYITSNTASDLSLKTLSKHFSISPNYLSKQFKSSTGIALSEYINISRIAVAEKLLTTTNYSITRIATECGFNDSNYFASVFKKEKGITPKKFAMLNR